MMSKKNIILTGIPRSGTTLACYLLNKSKDVVALVEPLNPHCLVAFNDDELIDYMDSFFEEQRALILTKKIAASRSVGGKVTDNVVSVPDRQTGVRVKVIDSNVMHIEKVLTDEFLLVIKHPSFFSAKLHTLRENYKCYAIIRNPLSVLLSWNSVEMSVTNGHAPAAENSNHELKDRLLLEENRIDRQLILLSWFYEQYTNNIESDCIFKYEDIISSNGQKLSEITGDEFVNNDSCLSSRNNNSFYDHSLKLILKQKLLYSNGAYWDYYDQKDVDF